MNSLEEYPFNHIPYPVYSANTDQFSRWIVDNHIIPSKWFKQQVNKIYKSAHLDHQDGYQDIIIELYRMNNKASLIKAFLKQQMNWWLIRFTMLQKLSLIQRLDSKQNKQNNYYILQDTVDYIDNEDDETDEKIIVKQLIQDMLKDRDHKWLLATTFLNYVKNDCNLAETARQMNINRNMAQNYIDQFHKTVQYTIKKYSK